MNRSPYLVRAVLLPALALMLPGCITLEVGGGSRTPLTQEVVFGEKGPKIAMLDIDGVIADEVERGALGLVQREGTVARVRQTLERAQEDEVEALILRLHSPGGTVTASDIVFEEIRRFKEETGLPVVAQVMGVAASGAYYAAMAADAIYAHPTSITGSIGVIFSGVNVSGLMKKAGVADQTLTTGAFKDSGSPLRPMRQDERRYLQSVLDRLHARFVSVVESGRPGLSPSQVASLADGRIFSAPEALELGLIDGISDLPATVREAERRAGLEQSRVVMYRRGNEWRENLYSRVPTTPRLSLDLGSLLGSVQGPGFFYLWTPGL